LSSSTGSSKTLPATRTGAPRLCRKILIDEIHIRIDRLSRNHRHKHDLVTTALTFRQDSSGSDNNQMRHAMGIVMDPINTRARSNSTRDKTRRGIHPTPVRRTGNCNRAFCPGEGTIYSRALPTCAVTRIAARRRATFIYARESGLGGMMEFRTAFSNASGSLSTAMQVLGMDS
jgi:hypothetical protein